MSQAKMNGPQDTLIQYAVDRAHELIDVPYKHQGRNPQHGLDCVGFIFQCYPTKAAKITMPPNYGMSPKPRVLLGVLNEHCDRVEDLQIGDLIVMTPRRQPQHLALYVGDDTIIHSYSTLGGVRKHKMAGNFSIYGYYRFK